MIDNRAATADLFGEEARFHHVGMLVSSISDDFPYARVFVDPVQKVRVAFVDLHGLLVEAVEPTTDESPVAAQAKKRAKLLHLCFEAPRLESALERARANGALQIAEPVPAVAFGGRRIAWIYSSTFGIVELLESQPAPSEPRPRKSSPVAEANK